MGKEILYSLANNESGQLIKAEAAQRSGIYFCLSCNGEMISRRGARVRPHFAHKNISPNCSPETALHYGFKKFLHERISKSLGSGEQIAIHWKCGYCSGSHDGNLLKRAVNVEEEYGLGLCRPDIALIGKEGNVVAVIEVVVSHSPEESTLEYYKAKSIPFISFILISDEDLARADADIMSPDVVDVCYNPECPECDRNMPRLNLLVFDGTCSKCFSPMKIAALRGDAGYEDISAFTDSHIALAVKHGASIETIYKTARSGYRYSFKVNTCKICNAFIGRDELWVDYVRVAYQDGYPITELDGGYYCPVCGQ